MDVQLSGGQLPDACRRPPRQVSISVQPISDAGPRAMLLGSGTESHELTDKGAAGLYFRTGYQGHLLGVRRLTGRTDGRGQAPLSMRVFLISAQVMVREGLSKLIESHGSMTVVGETGTRGEALQILPRVRPDIILFDPDPGWESGLDVIPELLVAFEGARVLVLTGALDEALHHTALHLGAMGVVLKDQTADVLRKAIERVHAGEAWIDRTTMGRMLANRSKPPFGTAGQETAKVSTLTERERQIVALVGEGLKNKQIAERLSISESTVRHHLTTIFAKLEVSDRVELLILAYRHQLTLLPKPDR